MNIEEGMLKGEYIMNNEQGMINDEGRRRVLEKLLMIKFF